MTTTIYPGVNWTYKLNDMAETSEDYIVDGVTIISLSNRNSLKLTASLNAGDRLILSSYFEDGLSINEDNMLVINTKTTIPPSYFTAFRVYLEDYDGNVATYSLDNNMVGKEQIILTDAFVKTSKDFNPSFIVKVGFIFDSPKDARNLMFILSDMHTVYRIKPTYAQPEEVVELLGMMDNKGNLFELTDASVPSYNTIAKRICEAEEFMENACRNAWTERRVVGEIRNADTVWAATFGYLGILASDTLENGTQMFFKGIPVKLEHDRINRIDYSKGDKVEVRRYGSEWMEVPEHAIWADEQKGIIYVKTIFFQKDASVRVTYRYGQGPCPGDIKQAVLFKVAMIIVGTDWYRQRFPQSPNFDPLKQETLNQWTWAIKDAIRAHTDVIACGSM